MRRYFGLLVALSVALASTSALGAAYRPQLHVTSGTVGEQLRVPQTDDDWAATRGHFALMLREAGLGRSDRIASWRLSRRVVPGIGRRECWRRRPGR